MIYDYKEVSEGMIKARTHGVFTLIDYVRWDGAPIDSREIEFWTIGRQSIVLPPSLPEGFRMATHPEWEKIRDRILEGWETAAYDRLDLMCLDLYKLSKLTGYWGGDDFNPLYEDRQDWAGWVYEMECSWSDLECDMGRYCTQLLHKAAPHFPPHAGFESLEDYVKDNQLECPPIGNRVKAPSKIEALRLMLAIAEQDLLGGLNDAA